LFSLALGPARLHSALGGLTNLKAMRIQSAADRWFTAMWVSFVLCFALTGGLHFLFRPVPGSTAESAIDLVATGCILVTGVSTVASLFYWITRGR
jgi:hypothetical protein